MWLYKLLDILATLSEGASIYLVVKCLCRCNRSRVFQIITWIIIPSAIFFVTWFTNLGEYKAIVLTVFNAIIIWLCYKDTFINTSVAAMLSMILIMVAEPIGTLAAEPFLYPMHVVIDGAFMVNWPLYIVIMAARLLLCAIVWHFMKNFVYQLQLRDLITILVDFVVMMMVYVFYYSKFFSGDPGYLNKTLELLMAVIGLSFGIHFLYTKNYHSVRAMREHDEYEILRLKEQHAYYQDKMRDEERVRSIYHDMKNHLLLLEHQGSNGEETRRMTETLRAQISDYENYYHTGNDFLNVIIRDKARAARERDIDFLASISLKDSGFIDPLDMSTIFGNALDNAIEANMKLGPEERMITVKGDRIRDMLSIVVENSMADNGGTTVDTEKTDIFLHGFGLMNIERAVGKYDGYCTSRMQEGKYILKVIIPVAGE